MFEKLFNKKKVETVKNVEPQPFRLTLEDLMRDGVPIVEQNVDNVKPSLAIDAVYPTGDKAPLYRILKTRSEADYRYLVEHENGIRTWLSYTPLNSDQMRVVEMRRQWRHYYLVEKANQERNWHDQEDVTAAFAGKTVRGL